MFKQTRQFGPAGTPGPTNAYWIASLNTAHTSENSYHEIPRQYRLSTYEFHLPPELVAQHPTARRDESRLLVIHRASGAIEHKQFRDLPALLDPSDLLVLNETKVVPALLVGHKATGGRVELLVMDPAESGGDDDGAAARVCLSRSSKPLRCGTEIHLPNCPPLVVEQSLVPGRVRVRFPVGESGLLAFLETHGRTPLPPYIHRDGEPADEDRDRYQTVYAATVGSVAAPTAGLHFTAALLEQLEVRGIEIARILLHVGPGTFMPVRNPDVRLHRMQAEHYEIPQSAAERIRNARAQGRRVVAAGTTSVRALESAGAGGDIRAGAGKTSLFITPGHRFALVEGMITNFHLPGSTLLMLVSSLAGIDVIINAYHEAVNERYRFYSYGDACLIID